MRYGRVHILTLFRLYGISHSWTIFGFAELYSTTHSMRYHRANHKNIIIISTDSLFINRLGVDAECHAKQYAVCIIQQRNTKHQQENHQLLVHSVEVKYVYTAKWRAKQTNRSSLLIVGISYMEPKRFLEESVISEQKVWSIESPYGAIWPASSSASKFRFVHVLIPFHGIWMFVFLTLTEEVPYFTICRATINFRDEFNYHFIVSRKCVSLAKSFNKQTLLELYLTYSSSCRSG